MALLELNSNLDDFRKTFNTSPPSPVNNNIDENFGKETPISDRINNSNKEKTKYSDNKDSKLLNLKSNYGWKSDTPETVDGFNNEYVDGFITNQKETAIKSFDYITLNQMNITDVTKHNSQYDDIVNPPKTDLLTYDSQYDRELFLEYNSNFVSQFLDKDSQYDDINSNSNRSNVLDIESEYDVDRIRKYDISNDDGLSRKNSIYDNLVIDRFNPRLHKKETKYNDVDRDTARLSILNLDSRYDNLITLTKTDLLTYDSKYDDINSNPTISNVLNLNSKYDDIVSEIIRRDIVKIYDNSEIIDRKRSIFNTPSPKLGNIIYTNVDSYVDLYRNESNLLVYATTKNSLSPLEQQLNKYKVRDVTYNSSYIKHPYVLRGIQRDNNSDGQSWGVKGDISGITAKFDAEISDTQRITKFQVSPRGIFSIAKQSALQFMNSAVETISPIGGIRSTQIFNPLSQTLAPTDLLIDRHGFGYRSLNSPFYYSNIVKQRSRRFDGLPMSATRPSAIVNDQGEGNRLIMLRNELLSNRSFPDFGVDTRIIGKVLNAITGFITGKNIFDGQVINKLSVTQGGPDSIYGIGGTLIRRAFVSQKDDYKKSGIENANTFSIKRQYSSINNNNFHIYGQRTKQFDVFNGNQTAAQVFYEVSGMSLENIWREFDALDNRNFLFTKKYNNHTVKTHRTENKQDNGSNNNDGYEQFYDIRNQYAKEYNKNKHPKGQSTKDISKLNFEQKRLLDRYNTLIESDKENIKPTNHTINNPFIKPLENTQELTGKGKQESPIAESLRAYGTTDYFNLKRNNNGGKYNDFRFDVNVENKETFINDPNQINIENNNVNKKYGIQDSGKVGQNRNNLLRTQKQNRDETTRQELLKESVGDKINLLDFTPDTGTSRLTKDANTLYTDDYQDMIKFFFTGTGINNVRPDDDLINTSNDREALVFRAFLENNITDNFNANWNSTPLMGRGDQVYNYDNFSRNISFNFKVVSFTREEMYYNWRKINYLTSMTAPDYTGINNRIKAPIIKLTIGDLYSQIPGFITNVTVTFPSNGWEIVQLNDENDMLQLPKEASLSVSYTTIGNYRPEKYGKMYDFDDVLKQGRGWLNDSRSF